MRLLRLTVVAFVLAGAPLFAVETDQEANLLESGDTKLASGANRGAIADYTQAKTKRAREKRP
jgi:hypothetical protein